MRCFNQCTNQATTIIIDDITMWKYKCVRLSAYVFYSLSSWGETIAMLSMLLVNHNEDYTGMRIQHTVPNRSAWKRAALCSVHEGQSHKLVVIGQCPFIWKLHCMMTTNQHVQYIIQTRLAYSRATGKIINKPKGALPETVNTENECGQRKTHHDIHRTIKMSIHAWQWGRRVGDKSEMSRQKRTWRWKVINLVEKGRRLWLNNRRPCGIAPV